MIKRIVRLTFEEGKQDIFLNDILPNQKHFTRNFIGCSHLEVWQDIHQPNIVFSYSYWESEEYLNEYRHSEKFISFWQQTKQLFADKPYAVSVKTVEVVE